MLYWNSKRIQRLVRSTFAGETLAAVDAEDTAVFLANMLASWLGIENLPVHVLNDCASLVDNMDAIDPKVTEKRLKLDLTGIRDNLITKAMESFRWIDTRIMLADCLTKDMLTDDLEEAFRTNRYPVVYRGTGSKKRTESRTPAQILLCALVALLDEELDLYG